MKRLWSGAVLLFCLCPAAGMAAEMPRVATYVIDLTYAPEVPGIEGRAEVSFAQGVEWPDVLTFFLHGELWTDEVLLNGTPVEVDQDLVFYPSDYSAVARRCRFEVPDGGAPKTLSIRYSGKLNPSVARAPSNYMRVDSDGVFLRSFPYSVWFPIFLEAGQDTSQVDAELTIRTPPDFVAVATGRRLSDGVEDGVRISRWRTVDDEVFNLQLTVRPFHVANESGLYLYFLNDAESRATAADIRMFSSRLVAYFRANYANRGGGEQLHVVQMPRFGDISSGNMVGISDRTWRGFDPASFSGRTLAHELVHPYVQIPVPSQSELYALVIEGFPSYFHLPAMGAILGEDIYQGILAKTEEQYLDRRQTGLDRRGRKLPVEKPLLSLTADEIGTYKDRFVLNDRARLFCDWLRREMGKKQFAVFTRELFSLPAIDTGLLLATIERYLPDSRSDVDVWLRTADFPDRFKLPGGAN